MSPLLEADSVAQAELFASGATTAEALLEASLAQIHAHQELGAFLHVSLDAARQTARTLDMRRARGETLGPLAGVPIAIKDALCTQDAPTTAASKILEGYVPPYDATVVARLRAADAVLVGKANMDEFAMGSSNEHSAYFPAKNPWDEARTPGGSSGGSAVSVAARMCSAALGSDTGGSVRQPAAFTGIVGLKPTYGRISRYGLLAYASSLDQVGPMASSVRSVARLLEVIAGHDPLDATSSTEPVPTFTAPAGDLRGVRIGVLEPWFDGVVDEGLRARHREAREALREAGATLTPVRWPEADAAIATYYVLASAEASSNLSRYDGIRYGLAGRGASLRERIVDARSRGFGAEVKRRILLGTFVLSAGYYDAYYVKALSVRARVRAAAHALCMQFDALLAPVTPEPAFALGARTADVMAMYASDLFTLPASLAGIPAASVPVGCCAAPRLPAAVQVMAGPWREAEVLRVATALEARFPREVAPSV